MLYFIDSFSCYRGPFNFHIKHGHNMLNYIYYSLYLDNIDTGDHNAIQNYVMTELVSPLIELEETQGIYIMVLGMWYVYVIHVMLS